MNKNMLIPVTICAFFVLVAACLSGGGVTNIKACTSVTVTSCDLDQYGGYVFGSVKNTCSVKINAVKIVAEVFSADGQLLSSDDEYVENLEPDEQKTFKAVMDPPAAKGKTCKAKVESGY